MGHSGRRATAPPGSAWSSPLLLNYIGQGALVGEPGGRSTPVLRLAPDWALYPMVVLASAATVIASQAVISGLSL